MFEKKWRKRRQKDRKMLMAFQTTPRNADFVRMKALVTQCNVSVTIHDIINEVRKQQWIELVIQLVEKLQEAWYLQKQDLFPELQEAEFSVCKERFKYELQDIGISDEQIEKLLNQLEL